MALSRFTIHGSRFTSVAAVLLSCVALATVLWGLYQLDVPVARFVRSLHHEVWGIPRAPWMAWVSDFGDWLAKPLILVAISVALLAVGLAFKRPVFRLAGLESLIAHAVAGLLSNGLKHLIGRPRPKFTHSGEFQFSPTLDFGLDSFPSGHATASFAVAAVLAKHFPRATWVLYGAASLVAMSRVLRGSHFPSDVVAGAGLGVLTGYVVANPIRAWRLSLRTAVTDLAPYLVGAFALIWTMVHLPSAEPTNTLTMAVGLAAMAVGSGSRFYRTVRGADVLSSGWVPSRYGANGLIGGGLALTTGSVLVMSLVALLILAQWLAQDQAVSATGLPPDSEQPPSPGHQGLVAEALFAAALIVAVLVIQGLKGVLPIL
ncbi:MAG: phosphatase PAP2 family protein [Nitrospiraceae bacterium]